MKKTIIIVLISLAAGCATKHEASKSLLISAVHKSMALVGPQPNHMIGISNAPAAYTILMEPTLAGPWSIVATVSGTNSVPVSFTGPYGFYRVQVNQYAVNLAWTPPTNLVVNIGVGNIHALAGYVVYCGSVSGQYTQTINFPISATGGTFVVTNPMPVNYFTIADYYYITDQPGVYGTNTITSATNVPVYSAFANEVEYRVPRPILSLQ